MITMIVFMFIKICKGELLPLRERKLWLPILRFQRKKIDGLKFISSGLLNVRFIFELQGYPVSKRIGVWADVSS